MLGTKQKTNRVFGILLGVLLALLLLGTFFDRQISASLLLKESAFLNWTAAYGEMPLYMVFCFCGMALVLFLDAQKRLQAWLRLALGIAMILGSAGLQAYRAQEYVNAPFALLLLLSLALCLLTCWGAAAVLRRGERKTVFWVCAILLTTALLSVGVTEGIKHFAARPRPRFVTENPSAFAAWWSFGTGRNARALYTAKGVLAEEFKSFPSGHAACAALLLMLPLLCRIDERLRGGEGVLFCAGSGVCFLICFSRVVSGAHYLSDVIFGVGVSFCVLWCVVALLDRMRAKRDARQAQPRRAERH